MFCLHVYCGFTCVSDAGGGQKRVLDHLELESQTVVSCLVGAGKSNPGPPRREDSSSAELNLALSLFTFFITYGGGWNEMFPVSLRHLNSWSTVEAM